MLNPTTMITAAMAFYASYALALPASNENLPSRAIVTHNGRQIDCSEIAFLAVMPPSELELKCRAAQDLPSLIDRREASRRAVVEHNGRTIDCSKIAFLAVMPPSKLEIKCRTAEGAGLGSVVVGKRAVVEFEGVEIDCENTLSPDVFPPTEAEMACRAAEGRE